MELEMMRQRVESKFAAIRKALDMRENLLNRQMDVFEQQQINIRSKKTAVVTFFGDKEEELLDAIRTFGRFQLDNLAGICFKNEDEEHETDMGNKQIATMGDANKSLIEHGKKNMHDSIISITLQEAKELIRKTNSRRETTIPPLNLEELDDELESSIEEVVSSLGAISKSSQTCTETAPKKSKNSRLKPKILINNCNINLRNIASLTINCTTEESMNAEMRAQTPPGGDSNEEYPVDVSQKSISRSESVTLESVSSTATSTSSSRSQSKKHKNTKSHIVSPIKPNCATNVTTDCSTYPYDIIDDTDDVTCDFYNRLLNEIKKSIKDKSEYTTQPAQALRSTQMVPNGSDSQGQISSETRSISSPLGRRLILKNFENLKVVLEAKSDGETLHPVQIEQWLAEIISETDLEPMQNTEILEHSRIHSGA